MFSVAIAVRSQIANCKSQIANHKLEIGGAKHSHNWLLVLMDKRGEKKERIQFTPLTV